jgi:hypothetical protein
MVYKLFLIGYIMIFGILSDKKWEIFRKINLLFSFFFFKTLIIVHQKLSKKYFFLIFELFYKLNFKLNVVEMH